MPELALTDEELAKVVQADFSSARQTRQEIESRRLAGYQLYRCWDDQTNPKGGQFATAPGRSSPRGQFNWSRLNVPISFIVVETILSRVVLQDPEIMCYGLSPDAAGYAQAKQMRIKHDLARCGYEDVQLVCLKDSAIYGDGFCKTVWDRDLRRPVITHVPWFDFWYSTEAMKHEGATTHFHVTWHDRASLAELADLEADGKKVYRNIDVIMDRGADRSSADDTYLTRRQYAGAGTPQPPSLDQRQIPIVECWYRDGTVVWLGGADYATVIRADPNPYVDPDGRPWRPFDKFGGTPDPESPYSISLVEMVEDFQREASSITRQALDQATRNINRPVKYDRNRVSDQEIRGAYSVPGGKLPVNGDPSQAVDEGTNVEVSRDFETAINRVLMLAQMTAGISDESAGMPPTTRPGVEDTATASWLRAHERNRRVGYLTFLISRALRQIACKLDWLDRQYNDRPVTVPLTSHFAMDPGAEGIDVHESGKVATVSNKVNGGKLRYDVKIDDGSLEVGFAGQKAARTIALSQALAGNPLMAQQVNWRELAAVMSEAAGVDPARVLVTQQQGVPVPDPNLPPGAIPAGAPAGAPGAPAPGLPLPGAPAGPPAPPPDGAGPVPVGPPIPLGTGAPGDGGPPLVGPAPAVPPPDIAALLAAQQGVPWPGGGNGGAPGGLPLGAPGPADLGMPPPPEPPAQQPVTININAGPDGVSVQQPTPPAPPQQPTVKRVIFLRDDQGQLAGAEIEEIPQDLPDTGMPPDMGMAPDQGGLPPDLVDQLGGM